MSHRAVRRPSRSTSTSSSGSGGLSTPEKLASLNPAVRREGQQELSQQAGSQQQQTVSQAESITQRGFTSTTTAQVVQRETSAVLEAARLQKPFSELTAGEQLREARRISRETGVSTEATLSLLGAQPGARGAVEAARKAQQLDPRLEPLSVQRVAAEVSSFKEEEKRIKELLPPTVEKTTKEETLTQKDFEERVFQRRPELKEQVFEVRETPILDFFKSVGKKVSSFNEKTGLNKIEGITKGYVPEG